MLVSVEDCGAINAVSMRISLGRAFENRQTAFIEWYCLKLNFVKNPVNQL
jgi:hypothetical protein